MGKFLQVSFYSKRSQYSSLLSRSVALHVATGPCEARDLGVVLPHEHMLLNFQGATTPAEYGVERGLSDLTFELKNLGKIRHFP